MIARRVQSQQSRSSRGAPDDYITRGKAMLNEERQYEAYLCSDLGDGFRRRIDARFRAGRARWHDNRIGPRVRRRSYNSVGTAAAAGAGRELDSGPARVTLGRTHDQRAGVAQPVRRPDALKDFRVDERCEVQGGAGTAPADGVIRDDLSPIRRRDRRCALCISITPASSRGRESLYCDAE
jgi:hypothetical protein